MTIIVWLIRWILFIFLKIEIVTSIDQKQMTKKPPMPDFAYYFLET